jgi:monothiol glutaredoxin
VRDQEIQMTEQQDWTEQLKRDVKENRVFIYAKGEKNAAMCGFSHRVMEVFNRLGVDYQVRNIFSDPGIKPALTAFTNWPTTPQVFIGGKFVGGCDIVVEMYQSGELQKLLEETA